MGRCGGRKCGGYGGGGKASSRGSTGFGFGNSGSSCRGGRASSSGGGYKPTSVQQGATATSNNQYRSTDEFSNAPKPLANPVSSKLHQGRENDKVSPNLNYDVGTSGNASSSAIDNPTRTPATPTTGEVDSTPVDNRQLEGSCSEAGNKMHQSWHTSKKLQRAMLDFHEKQASFPKAQVADAQVHHKQNIDFIRDELKRKGVALNVEYTGSSYEGIKVPSTDMEFDVMVVMKGGKDAVATPVVNCPLYAKLSPKDQTDSGSALGKIIEEKSDETIVNPKKAMEYMHGQIQRVINENPEQMKNVKLRQHGPAVQMDVYQDPSQKELFYSVDLVPTLQVPHGGRFYVAKSFKETGESAAAVAEDTWRLSFSPHEKDKIKNIDMGNECRKQVMRSLKVLRDKEPGLHGLNSYILKSSVMNMEREERESSEHVAWCQPRLGQRTIDTLQYIATGLEKNAIPHYYVSQYNLLSGMPDKQRENMMYRVKELIRSEEHFHAALNK